MPVQRQSPCIRYCFTLNNWTAAEYLDITVWLTENCNYWIVGKEVGQQGTEHLQGYFELKKKKRIVSLRKDMSARAHYEVARGSGKQASDYCKKENNFTEHGEIGGQGSRNDLQAVAECLRNGGSMFDVADQFPVQYMMYNKGIEKWKETMKLTKERDFKTRVLVMVGPPGTGKSRRANEISKRFFQETYYKPRGDWWDGFSETTECVIIDDFYGWLKYDEVLKICDRYPYRVPIKGGFVNFRPKMIIFTSNHTVDKWYKFEGYDPAAFERRIEHKHLDSIPDLEAFAQYFREETQQAVEETEDNFAELSGLTLDHEEAEDHDRLLTELMDEIDDWEPPLPPRRECGCWGCRHDTGECLFDSVARATQVLANMM